MTRAYQETKLSDAMALMGEAVDYVVNDCHISGEDFLKIFAVSEVCRRIENGEAAYLVGKSGAEVVRECVYRATGREVTAQLQPRYQRTPEYWVGWALAYYQWHSSRKYTEILKAISFEELLVLYPTLHEADVTKFADIMDVRLKEVYPETNLKRIRTLFGCSQSELAAMAGVSLRSIQMYEQRQKDINRASVATVNSLAKALGCTVEDLMEK